MTPISHELSAPAPLPSPLRPAAEVPQIAARPRGSGECTSAERRESSGPLAVVRATAGELSAWCRSSERRRLAATLGLLLAGNVAYAVYRATHLSACDLVHGYLIPTRGIFWEGKSPTADYSFNSFAPFFYVVMAPFAALPNWAASLLWSLLSLGFVAGIVGLLRAILARTFAARPISPIVPLVLAATLLADNLYLGQSNLFALFFICCALYALVLGQDLRSGLWVSVAIAWKLTPAIFLLYLALKRRWRALAGAGLGLVVCFGLIPALAYGPRRAERVTRDWAALILAPMAHGASPRSDNISWYHTNQSLDAFAHRHLTPFGKNVYGGLHAWVDPSRLDDAEAAQVALVGKLLILGVVVVVCLRRREVATPAFALEASLLLLAALFLSPVSWYSHYVAALVAYGASLQALAARPFRPGTRTLAITLAAAGLVTSLSLSDSLRSYSPVFLAHLALFGAIAAWLLRSPPEPVTAPPY